MAEKNCKNCKYYKFHYVKDKQHLLQLAEGHCTNLQLFSRIRDKRKIFSNCQFWEPMELQKEERKKVIKEVLRDMEKSLRTIEAILKSDED